MFSFSGSALKESIKIDLEKLSYLRQSLDMVQGGNFNLINVRPVNLSLHALLPFYIIQLVFSMLEIFYQARNC